MRSKEKTTNIIFVRHGMTGFPLDRIYCDEQENPPLNEAGEMQASAAATFLADEPVAQIYASPILRTNTTANCIAKATGAPVELDSGLVERRFGIWEGLYFHEIEEQFPDEYLQWKTQPIEFAPEGGETVNHLAERVQSRIDSYIEKHEGQTIVVVSHVGPIRVAATCAIRMPIDAYRWLRIDYAALTRIDYGRRQNNLTYLNLTPYRHNP